MSTQINGTGGITFPDSSTMASAQVGMKNRIIDGGFIINQRVYVSGASLSAGTYAHDRWKAGAGGCTYTFTQGALGVNTTITITAGSLIQVIEGCNVAEGGTYVLSWTGTAQGRLNGGSYGASGITITGWTAGTNLNVEFNTGTVGSVQLEKGSTATSFDYRPYGQELALCQRYFIALKDTTTQYSFAAGYYGSTTQANYCITYPTTMRTFASFSSSGTFEAGFGDRTLGALSLNAGGIASSSIAAACTGATTGQGTLLRGNGSAVALYFSAEL